MSSSAHDARFIYPQSLVRRRVQDTDIVLPQGKIDENSHSVLPILEDLKQSASQLGDNLDLRLCGGYTFATRDLLDALKATGEIHWRQPWSLQQTDEIVQAFTALRDMIEIVNMRFLCLDEPGKDQRLGIFEELNLSEECLKSISSGITTFRSNYELWYTANSSDHSRHMSDLEENLSGSTRVLRFHADTVKHRKKLDDSERSSRSRRRFFSITSESDHISYQDLRIKEPALTWYRILVTTSITVIGVWKFVAVARSQPIISNVLDLVIGLIMALLFFWLSEYRESPRLRFLFKSSAVDDLRRAGSCVYNTSSLALRDPSALCRRTRKQNANPRTRRIPLEPRAAYLRLLSRLGRPRAAEGVLPREERVLQNVMRIAQTDGSATTELPAADPRPPRLSSGDLASSAKPVEHLVAPPRVVLPMRADTPQPEMPNARDEAILAESADLPAHEAEAATFASNSSGEPLLSPSVRSHVRVSLRLSILNDRQQTSAPPTSSPSQGQIEQ